MSRGDHNKREENAKDFAAAEVLATEHGMKLTAMTSNLDSKRVYRIEGPGGEWYKDIYPDTQRIYCPDRKKQGPFVAMRIGQRWTLLDLVRVCVNVVAKEAREKSKAPPVVAMNTLSGDAYDNRQILLRMLEATERAEECDTQSAFRDILTDMCHIAGIKGVDMDLAVECATAVYIEERDDPEFNFERPGPKDAASD